jgi:hypothetical protein
MGKAVLQLDLSWLQQHLEFARGHDSFLRRNSLVPTPEIAGRRFGWKPFGIPFDQFYYKNRTFVRPNKNLFQSFA